MTGGNGLVLLVEPLAQVVAVGDAVAVGDDEARPVVGLGLPERGERLVRVGAHGHARHVDVAVGDGLQGDVLLVHGLACRGELGHGTDRSGLRRLPAGVGVDLGVHDEDVDVAPGGQDVVEPTRADVVGPAVAADDPHAAPQQVVGHAAQVVDGKSRVPFQAREQLGHPFPLGRKLGFADLPGIEDGVGEVGADDVTQLCQPVPGQLGVQVGGQAQPEAELGVVLEQRVRPGRPAACRVLRPRRGRQVAAVDRGASGGVGDGRPLPEQLAQELEVGRLATAGAGAGELEERLEELGAADGPEVDPGTVVERQRLEELDVAPLGHQLGLERLEVDRLAGGVARCDSPGRPPHTGRSRCSLRRRPAAGTPPSAGRLR